MRAIGPILVVLAAPVWASKPIPTSPDSYVHNEGVVRADTADQLSSRLRQFEQATGHQFVVALFQSLDGEDLETYVNQVFRQWKIGDAKRNDGLLFCVFLKDHRWRVEVGYGLEPVVTDLEAAEIVRDSAVPLFKTGDYDAGVLAAVVALSAKAGGPAESDATRSRSRRSERPWWLSQPMLNFEIFLLLILLNALLSRGRHGMRSAGSFWYLGGGGWGGGGGWSGGGFSGGGGSSGGGGASGGW
jgi:uncharacterized protein